LYGLEVIVESVPSVSVGWLVFGRLMSETIHDLDTDLLGKGQLDSLAGGGSQCSQAFLKSFRIILDLWDSDTFLFREVLTADSWERDGFVDTGLDGLGVGDGDSRLNNSHDRDIVASLLGNLLAVVLSVSMWVAIPILGRLTHGYHLGFALLHKRNLDGLGGGDFTLWFIRVAADLVVDFFCAFSTDCARNSVTLFSVNYSFNSKFYRRTFCFQSWGANLCELNHVLHSAVVFWVLVPIARLGVPVRTSGTSSDQGDYDKEENLHCC